MNTRTIGMAKMLLRHRLTDACRHSGLEAWREVPVLEGQSGDDVVFNQRREEDVVAHMQTGSKEKYRCNSRLICVEYRYTGEGE